MIGVSILGGALFLYALLSYIRTLRLRWWWKVLLSLPLAAVAFKFQLLYWVWGGHLFRPQVPVWLELGSNWLFMALLLFVPLLVALDALRLPLWCLLRRRPGWKRVNNVLNSLLMLATLVTTAVGMHHAFALPEVREITLRLPQLREPVRLAMLTDLHADRYKQAEFFREVVTRTNALQADAVVITGDFEDGHLYSLAPALAPLRHLESRWGVYAVDGNHDYFSGHDAWQRYLKKLGIRFLNNEHVLPGPATWCWPGYPTPQPRATTAPRRIWHKLSPVHLPGSRWCCWLTSPGWRQKPPGAVWLSSSPATRMAATPRDSAKSLPASMEAWPRDSTA